MGSRIRHHAGGILGAVEAIEAHGGALEYDLMTRAGMTLDDIPSRMSWRALINFYTHLDAGSALFKEISPEVADWQGTGRLPMLLADLIDSVNMMRYENSIMHRRRRGFRPKKPKPYPRPWVKEDKGTKIGRDPIPAKDFDSWWEGGDRCLATS